MKRNGMLKAVASFIRSIPALKRVAHWLLVPENEYRPRGWVKKIANPLVHSLGKNSIIRETVRQDIFPYNQFFVGNDTLIEDFATVNNGVGDVRIGEHTVIGLHDVIIGPVSIGNHVMLAQNVVVSGLNHGYEDVTVSPKDQPVSRELITIGDRVWIGANSVITAGVTIGKHAVIGAGSVVSGDVPPYSVAVGNPARVVKSFNFQTNTWEKAEL